jgi:ABC-type glycerol-3-phosphate transport system substrate-binding protein
MQIWVGIAVAACAGVPPAATPTTSPLTITPRAANPIPTSTPPSSAALTRTPFVSTAPITLTLWISDEWAQSGAPAGRVLQDHLAAFQKENPTLRVNVVLKKPYGVGGLYDALSTTRDVVPARLPDLITLDFNELALAAGAQLIQPLQGLAASEIESDLFSFARVSVPNQNQWIGVGFSADVQHLATLAPAPRTWDDFTRQKSGWLIPLASDDALIVQYLGLGATLSGSSASIEPSYAAQVLNFYKRARELALIPDAAISLESSDDAWSLFASGQVSITVTSATRYLNERAKMPQAQAAPIPTRDGRVAASATGWAFAIVSSDPVRHAAATRWIEWMMQKERLTQWTRAAQRIPATRGALALAVTPAEYAAFLRNLLDRAVIVHLPPKQAEAWRNAIAVVWKNQATPEEAARNFFGTK